MSHAPQSPPGLAALFVPPTGPTTPDAGAPRPVQKLVLRVKGKDTGGLAAFYMRLAVPRSTHTQTVPLFSDEGVTLKSSQVYPVSLAKGGRTVIPPDASRQLQRAHDVLSSRPSVSRSGEDQGNGDCHAAPQTLKSRAKITTQNFHVTLVVPPELTDSAMADGFDDKSHFVAIVQLSVPFSRSPPRWPYMVRIPLPRCLNNYLHFSVDEGAVQNNTIVEVVPPLLPKPPVLATGKSRRKSGVEVDKEGDADDDQTLSGPFYSATTLSIQWANADAGVDKKSNYASSSGHHPVRADMLRTSVRFSSLKMVNPTTAEWNVDVQLALQGFHYPGLDTTANVTLTLQSPEMAQWVPESVSVVPSKASTTSLHSWSVTSSNHSSVHSIKSKSNGGATKDDLFSPLSGSSPHDSSADNSEVDETVGEESNLVDVRPPKEIASSDFDSSFDADLDEQKAGIDTPSTERRRRHSLGGRAMEAKLLAGLEGLDKGVEDTGKAVYLVLNVAAASQAEQQFTCAIKGRVMVHVDTANGGAFIAAVPMIRAPGLALEGECSLDELACSIVQRGGAVKAMDGVAQYRFNLAAWPTPADIDDCVLKIRVEQREASEEVGDISGATTTRMLEPAASDDSLDPFASNISQQAEGEGLASHATQVEMLSGIIHHASAEVYSEVGMEQEDLLRGKGHQTVKTTHVIRSSWPSTPAPASGSSSGSLLPRLVFAISCSEGSEVQILYASLNGLSIHVAEESGSAPGTHSRIVDLQLPDVLRNTSKVDVYLLYTLRSPWLAPLCVFPAVASSVAELDVSVRHSAPETMTTSFSFANSPLVCMGQEEDSPQAAKQMRAYMLPAMTNAMLIFHNKPASAILFPDGALQPIPLAIDGGLLRRSASLAPKRRGWRWTASRLATLLHVACTSLLAFILIGTLVTMEPQLGGLSRKVNSLAIALDVDFSEGSWKPEQDSTPVDVYNSIPQAVQWRDAAVERSERVEASHRPQEPHELSVDTTSFALVLQSLSLGLTRTVTWPLRLLFALWNRLPL